MVLEFIFRLLLREELILPEQRCLWVCLVPFGGKAVQTSDVQVAPEHSNLPSQIVRPVFMFSRFET